MSRVKAVPHKMSPVRFWAAQDAKETISAVVKRVNLVFASPSQKSRIDVNASVDLFFCVGMPYNWSFYHP